MKRIISAVLSLIIILSLVCVAAPTAFAASDMKTSSQGINMIKSFEGFVKWPQMDNGQWTVGYGTGVSGEALEKYKSSGITQDEATELLAEYLGSFEDSVNDFIDDNNLKLSQNQFDALVSFTYNLGPSWMQSSGTFRTAVIKGKTGNDFIYAIAQFGKAGGSVVGGLVERRLCEANLYLNGVYSVDPPANFKYVIYNGNMENAIPDVTIQGYDTTKTAAIKATVTKAGYRFLGWYTKAEGGQWITSLGANSASASTLYAHWQEGDGPLNKDGSVKGTTVSYTGYAPSGEQKIYDEPNGKKVGTTKTDEKVKVTAEYVDSKGVKWGKIGSKKWINITKGLAATPSYENSSSAISPVTVTVTTNNVNNRIGPGTNYSSQGTYSKGEQIVISAVQKGGNYTWGKTTRGWIALNYTDYATSSVSNSADAKKVTGIATITGTDVLNVRAGAGTNTAKVGTYLRGEEVKISLRQKVGSTTWALTEKGWISLYYAKVKDVKEGTEDDIEISTGVIGGSASAGSNSNGNTAVISTGVVYNCDTLRIRSDAGTSNAKIGEYRSGTYVNILETKTVKSEIWGRTDRGWISLRYVKLDAPTTGMGVTGRVVKCSTLNVRSGAGTHYPKTGKLAEGTKVEILDYTKVGNTTWGRIAQGGWISLDYVALDASLDTLGQNNGATGSTGGSTSGSTNSGSTGSNTTATEPSTSTSQGKQYSITINSMKNGSVAASGKTAAKGDVVTLSIAPAEGYELDTLTVKDSKDNVISVTDNKFTMPAAKVTVDATFKAASSKHNITINSASNGKITANKSVAVSGEEIILTAEPKSGYELDTLTVMNTTTNAQVAVFNGKFVMPAGNVNIVATFKKADVDTFKVSVKSMTNGSVTASTTSAKEGTKVTLTVNPASGYALEELIVKNASTNAAITLNGTGATRTFNMPAGDVSVTATFKVVKYSVTIAGCSNGSVSVNPDQYAKGETVTLNVKANTGYVLDKLTVKDENGAVITAINNKFTMPASDVEVTATFKDNAFVVDVTTSKSGTATASAKTAKAGETITIKCDPNTNYEVNTVTVTDGDGNEVTVNGAGNTRTFEMPVSNVTVHVAFKVIKYDVTINEASNGKVTTEAEQYAKGKTVALKVKADKGYMLDELTVKDANGKAVSVKDNEFTMPASNVTVTASFKKNIYNITVSEASNGKVTSSHKTRGYNNTVTLTVEPKSGYVLESLTVKDSSGKAVEVSGTGATRTFDMPASNVTVTASFEVAPVYFDVTVDSAITNGTVTVNKSTAEATETITVTATPADGYELDKIKVNGEEISGKTFKMPKDNAVVSATFKAVRTITVTVRNADGITVQGVSVVLCNESTGVAVTSAKSSDGNGKVTFSTSNLADVAEGMTLVALVRGDYVLAEDASVSAGLGLSASGDGLTVTAAADAPIKGSITIKVESAI